MVHSSTIEFPVITDDDILRASRLMGLRDDAFYGEDGMDPRQEILKSNAYMDIAACPGSGKTTLLVAKLAILAEKWQFRTRGICVLSHTNVARREIEARLGLTSVGRWLLSYPHFIGTIHGFVNEYLALPWLQVYGHPIKVIDTDICEMRRWNKIGHQWRSALNNKYIVESDIRIIDDSFNWALKRGTCPFSRHTTTYKRVRNACLETFREGYHCYDDMFIWANELLAQFPDVIQVVRSRFPLLFIDEAQDNSEEQSAILHRLFVASDSTVIRQRFGDDNQAIFDSVVAKEASIDRFPGVSITKKDLPNSHRFGQKVADLADPLGIIPYGLKGEGPKAPLASGVPEARHTIFLFDDNGLDKVLGAYAELLTDTFSGQELQEGTFTAVGQVHRDTGDDQAPRHVGHYWPDYDPVLASRDPKPKTFLQYVVSGLGRAEASEEMYPAVEKVAEGILRLARMADGGAALRHPRYTHRYLLELLEHSPARDLYEEMIDSFVVKRLAPLKEEWGNRCSIVRKISEAIVGASLSGQEANRFLAWEEGEDALQSIPALPKNRDNRYHFSKDGKDVVIRVGSIHSIKGETHMATLVLETFWHLHNLEQLLPWLSGSSEGGKSVGLRQNTRLKIHYVAMTRPSHLVCLAMKRSSINSELVHQLEQRGWQCTAID